MKIIYSFALLFFPALAVAQTWNCRNPEIEVGCSETACSASHQGDFTPMDVAFDSEGYISACMYSGCWEGQGTVFRENGFMSIHAAKLVYSTDPEPGTMRQDLAILVDLEDNVAILKAGSYAQPLRCTVRDAG